MISSTTLGDLAQSFRLQRQTGDLKLALERLSTEVTTGLTTDKAKAVKGDFLPLAGIERSLKSLESYRNAIAETRVFVEAGQRSLETVQEFALSAGTNLISLAGNSQTTVLGTVTRDVRQSFSSVLAALNTQVGDRSIFAGVSTNTAAVADIETIMADLVVATSAATTAQDVIAGIEAWFDTPGGGYETLGFVGSTRRLADFDLGLGQSTSFDIAADDTEIRDILKGFAMGSILEDGAFSLAPDEQRGLVSSAGEALLTADKKFAEYRAKVGTAEGQIQNAEVRNSGEVFALQMARAEIVTVDQYSAAGRLEAAQVQLEMLYTLTARMSRLNLMEYI